VDKTADEQAVDRESCFRSWSDEELFGNMVDIINENFVLEVEANLRLRS